jgi:hypothetical protein
LALVETHSLYYPFQGEYLALTSSRQDLINASGERVGIVVDAPRTGSITQLAFLTGAVTTADDLDIRLETVTETTAANYEPSGTLYAANTNATLSSGSISANSWHTVTLTSSASVTAGDKIAVVIQFTSDTTATGSLEITSRGNGQHYFPRVLHRTGGSYANDTNSWPVVGLSYAGTYYPMYNGNSYTSSTSGTVAAGAEFGVKFTLPFDCRLRGVEVESRIPTGTNMTIELYTTQNPGSGTELMAATETPTTLSGIQSYHLASPQTLNKDTSYRLTVDPTTSVNAFPFRAIYDSVALMSQDVGPNWHFTQDNGAGGWTDTTTQVPIFFALILDQVNDTAGGAGGGLLTHPGMSGGARG